MLIPMLAQAEQAVQNFDQHWLFHMCAIFGTVVGAIAGATASSRVRMDIFGVIACGSIAALGGGTVRDILLGGLCRPNGDPVSVFWVTPGDAEFLYYAVCTSFIIFYITRVYTPPVGTIRVADAFAMAFFTLLGVAKAHYLGCPWLVSITMGVCTGVAGGVLRDVFTGNVPYVFRPGELYATASFIGSALFVLLQYLGVTYSLSFTLGVAAVFCTRMAAVYLKWELPSYRPLFDNVRSSEEDAPPGREAASPSAAAEPRPPQTPEKEREDGKAQ